jgi:integrase
LALKWEDVELKGAVLRVRRTLTRTGGKVALGAPKTTKSRRSVGLTQKAVVALRDHLARQLEEMEQMGSLYRPGGLVFANENGGIINPSNLRNRSFARLFQRAGLPPTTRFHDLHTCATLLLAYNVNPKIVSEMLGHSSISITLDIYSHLLPNMQESAVRALDEALS